MKKILLFATALMGLSICVLRGQEPIQLDPQVRVGRLENGLTYYIRPNDAPKNRADFYIVTNVGAVQEEDSQDGLAHFLEHLAFNGLEHFPGKSMLEFTERNGIKFGYDVNAYTSRNETVYNVANVPMDRRESLIDSVLLIMHDWSGSILCEQSEIDAERGVIREEWRLGNNAKRRMFEQQNYLVCKGSRYAHRTVLGNFDIINNFERQTLIDFYKKWYRPDMQALIVVGDFNPDQMEAKIKQSMSDLPKVENGAQKSNHDIPYLSEPMFGLMTDPDIQYVVGKIYLKHPYHTAQELASTEAIKKELADAILNEALSTRFKEMYQAPQSKIKSCVCITSPINTQKFMTMFTITPKDDKDVVAATNEVYTEICRAAQHGFTESEIAYAKTVVSKKIRLNQDLIAGELTNGRLVTQYIDNFTRNIPYMNPKDKKELQRKLFKEIDHNYVNGLIPVRFTNAEEIISFGLNENKVAEYALDENTILARIKEIKASTLPKFSNNDEEIVSLKSENLKGSKIVKTSIIKNTNIEKWRLENGIEVVWTPVEEAENRAANMIISGNSHYDFSLFDDVPAHNIARNIIQRQGSVKGLNRNQYTKAISHLTTNITERYNLNGTRISASTNDKEFEEALNLIYLKATNFYIDTTDFKLALKSIKDQYQTIEKAKNPSSIYQDSLIRLYYDFHPWSKRTTSADCDRVDINTIYEMNSKTLGNCSDITFFITGTMSKDEVVPLVEKYIGSLPIAGKKKGSKVPPYFGSDKHSPFIFEGKERDIPKSSVNLEYFGKIKYCAENNMAFKYLNHLLNTQYVKSIREEKGGTYGVMVNGEISYSPFHSYILTISFETNPEMAEELLDQAIKDIEDIAENGPNMESFNASKDYLIKMSAQKRENQKKSVGYWHDHTIELMRSGTNLNQADLDVISSVTPEQVQKLAKKIVSGKSFKTIFSEKHTK